jgi:hypothetical protein
MFPQPKVSVIYYSSTGSTYEIATSIAEGAEKPAPRSGCSRFTNLHQTR